MQGFQIKTAIDDYRRSKELEDEDDDEEVQGSPPQATARYSCKAFDGVVEGFVFAAVALHVIFTDVLELAVRNEYVAPVVYLCAFFCFLSSGMSLMEIDVLTSMSMQTVIGQASLNRVRHLAFRSAEFAVRLLTLLTFVVFMVDLGLNTLWPVVLFVDYVVGVSLLVKFGGHDPCWAASLILGVPLAAVNVMQFVDAPGMSFSGQRITSIIVPWRILETVCVVLLVSFFPGADADGVRVRLTTHPELLVFAGIAVVIYTVLLLLYAMRVQRSADLHTVINAGDAEALQRLLENKESLDVDRYGPNGHTPLHEAAARGQETCISLLLKHGAKLGARTNMAPHHTTLHLAAQSNDAFLNLTNDDGDTALHIAARRQNVDALQQLLRDVRVDFRLKNHKNQTPADCAPSDKFGFDRDSREHAVAEELRKAEQGQLERSNPKQGIEMVDVASSRAAPGSAVDRMTTTRTGEGGGDDINDDNQHEVVMLGLTPHEEKRLMGQKQAEAGFDGFSLANSGSVGLSTFMLSAGLGALSLAFTARVAEQNPDTATADQPDVKTKLDDFNEIKAVGEGAFGKVVMVKHKETGEIFAMKLMDKAKFKAQKITRKAHSEQFILKTTRHPFIVSLHYAFQGQTFWALVMDMCPNGDLQKLLVDYGNPGLPLKETARYAGEVLLAIEHLHSIRVIFRDLKLENVVIDTKWRARVADFGLAKKLQTEADAKTMCGSYGYAAPEIMMNTGRYTYAVDLYSFGVMLYMMVSGGEESTKKKQRLPPVRHASLRRKLREAEKNEGKLKWVSPEIGAWELLMMLTAENPADRTTPTKVTEHRFFEQQLGRSVKSLLNDEGPFVPPQKPAKQERAPRR